MLKRDKAVHIQTLADKAQSAAWTGNMSMSFGIVRTLAGRPMRRVNAVRDANGELIANEHDKRLRWQEHFVEVFGATVARSIREAVPTISALGIPPRYYTVGAVQQQIDMLPAGKACGGDGVMAELIQAACALYTWFL